MAMTGPGDTLRVRMSGDSTEEGQTRQAVVASAPRTYAPLTRSTKVPTTAATASQVQPPVGNGTVDGQRTITARIVSAASSSSAFARWTVTHSGGSSRTTVIAPSTACSG